VLCSSQDHLRTRTRDLDHPILCGAKNTDKKCNTTFADVRKYEESLKCYYNKSVVLRELDIGDLVLKKVFVLKTSISFHHPRKDHSSWWTLQTQALMY
jgi:hypothetical protein